MRGVFGFLGLVLVLAVVGVLVRKQLSVVAVPTATTATPGETAVAPGNAAEQSRRIQEQIKKDLEKALQQPRLAEEP